MTEKFAELKIDDNIYKLPIKSASIGASVIDVRSLYANSGYFTYDPGFMSTASCTSRITYIDGDEGILRHRGYDVKELAEKKDFLDVSYLLLNNSLPTQDEHKNFAKEIKKHFFVNEKLTNIFKAFKNSAHPMSVMLSAIGALSGFYHDQMNIDTQSDRNCAAIRLIAKMPTIAAMTYRHMVGEKFVDPREDLSFSENFLYMMFADKNNAHKVSPVIAKALDKIFILHADHEQNASTSTVRTVGSSGANPFACISAGIASLWGKAHGGANEAVINMLEEIGDVENIPEYINRAKDKNDPFRLMGFGHRVYKHYDPRAESLKGTCKDVLSELGQLKNNKILNIAIELEKIALNDQYFVDRKLFPNVDFYSGIIYKAMGIPSSMFTVLFTIARTSGWASQWKEMWENPSLKITRPRQLYLGERSKKL